MGAPVECGGKGLERGTEREVWKSWCCLAWKRRSDQDWFLASFNPANTLELLRANGLNKSDLPSGFSIYPVDVPWAPAVEANVVLGFSAVAVNTTDRGPDPIKLTFSRRGPQWTSSGEMTPVSKRCFYDMELGNGTGEVGGGSPRRRWSRRRDLKDGKEPAWERSWGRVLGRERRKDPEVETRLRSRKEVSVMEGRVCVGEREKAVQDEVREGWEPGLTRLLATSLTALYPGTGERNGPKIVLGCMLRAILLK